MLRIPHCLDNGLIDGGKVVEININARMTGDPQLNKSLCNFRFYIDFTFSTF
jgi:hypothetical protein